MMKIELGNTKIEEVKIRIFFINICNGDGPPSLTQPFCDNQTTHLIILIRHISSNHSNMGPKANVQETLGAYTVSVALCLRTHFFFKLILEGAKTPAQKKAIKMSRECYLNGKFSVKGLTTCFTQNIIDHALALSKKSCLRQAEKRCKPAEGLDACSVCLELKAGYYIFHNGSAHKCVCAVCAMELCLRQSPKCPICRQGLSLVADSAPVKVDCVCGLDDCSKHLVLSVQGGKSPRGIYHGCKTLVECTTCTLSSQTPSEFCVVYDLY